MRSLTCLLLVLLTACAAPVSVAPAPTLPPSVTSIPSPSAYAPSATAAPAATASATPPATAEPSATPSATVGPTPEAAITSHLATFGYGKATAAAFFPDGQAAAVATSGGLLLLELPGLNTRAFTPLDGGAADVQVSPDGGLIATSHWAERQGSHSTRILRPDGAELTDLPGYGPQFSADGSTLAVQSSDPETGESLTLLYATVGWNPLAEIRGTLIYLGPNGSQVLTKDDGQVSLWWDRGEQRRQFVGYDAAISPDGSRLAVVGLDGIAIYALGPDGVAPASPALLPDSAGAPVQSLSGLQATDLRTLRFNPEGTRLDALVGGRPVSWELPSGIPAVPAYPAEAPQAVAIGPGGHLLIIEAPGEGVTLMLYAADGRQIFDNRMGVGQVSFAPVGGAALVVTAQGELSLVSASGPATTRLLPAYSHIAISPDGESLVAGAGGPLLDLWPIAGGDAPASRTGVANSFFQLFGLRFMPDGAQLIALHDSTPPYGGGWFDLGALSWNLVDGAGPTSLSPSPPTDAVQPLWDYSPAAGGRTVWVGDGDAIQVQDAGGDPRALLNAIATALTLSPDGQFLALGDSDGRVRLLNIADGAARWEALLPLKPLALAFSPDGAMLAAASFNGTIALWRAADGAELLRFHPPELYDEGATDGRPPPARLAISLRGDVVAVGGASGVAVYTLAGDVLLRLPDPANDLAFTPDGSALAVVSRGHVKLWRVRQR